MEENTKKKLKSTYEEFIEDYEQKDLLDREYKELLSSEVFMGKNGYIGSSFDSFLEEEGILNECKEEAAKRYRGYREHLIEKLKDSEYASAYLDACLEESFETKDVGIFQLAIRDVVEANGHKPETLKEGS